MLRRAAGTSTTRVRVLLIDVALAFERIEREAQLVRAGLAGRQIDASGWSRSLSRGSLHVARGEQRVAIVDAQPRRVAPS